MGWRNATRFYPNFPDEMTELGKFIFYRTYSRYLPEKRRRETWKEVCLRAISYNTSLAETSEEEKLKLFDNMFHLRQFLSGRTNWVGGTDVAKKFPMSNFNCAFVVIDEFEAFRDLFYLLMIGSGVGFRVRETDAEKLPKVRTDIEYSHREYEPIPPDSRQDNTTVLFFNDQAVIDVGDSKEGWVQALDMFLRLHWDRMYIGVNKVRISYNNVRPKGERLKTFGGTASGHESLRVMFEKIGKVLSQLGPEKYESLRPIHCLDIANIIGENVVSGGVRRTSEIGLFDADDLECVNAKSSIYTQTEEGIWVTNQDLVHRSMSNNSVIYWDKPTKEQLMEQMEKIRYTGEPGFINGEQARKRFPAFEGVNPCAEILLASRGLCNLVTVNVMGFVSDGELNEEALLEAQRLSARASLRMTCVDLELPKWDRVQKEHRLIGCSLTGWQDAMESCGYTKEQANALLRKLREVATEEAKAYARTLGINEPKLVTTVKPEGTLSLLPTVSSGVHYSHSPYYIRRVRISAHDPLTKVCEELGWSVEPVAGQTEENCSTKVIEFPVKVPVKRTKGDVGAIEQLECYKSFMENYVQHNASITVHVREHEWGEVTEWLHENWDSVVGISFLPYDDSSYPQMPYEEIDEEEYLARVEKMAPFKPELISKYELEVDFDIDDSSCENGVCPVR